LGKDVYKFYKRIELAEIILLNRLEIGTCTINNNLDYAVLEKLARQFERDGFGFIRLFPDLCYEKLFACRLLTILY